MEGKLGKGEVQRAWSKSRADASRHTDQTRPEQTRPAQTRAPASTARITAPAGIKLPCISSVPWKGPWASQSVEIEPVD